MRCKLRPLVPRKGTFGDLKIYRDPVTLAQPSTRTGLRFAGIISGPRHPKVLSRKLGLSPVDQRSAWDRMFWVQARSEVRGRISIACAG